MSGLILYHFIVDHSLLICYLMFFFFNRSGDLRYLHSFPTRRSSDLGSSPGGAARCHRRCTRCRTAPAGRSRTARWRSEEHTSELQSLTNLVCRLLLEKKKEITIP